MVLQNKITKKYDTYKDSGIKWIGEIPQEWEVTQISKLYNITLGKMLCAKPISDTDTLENYLCSANIKFEGIKTDEIKQMYFNGSEKKLYLLEQNDILISEGGDAGTVAIYNNEAYPCYIQNAVYKVTANNKQIALNKFLYYWMFFCKKCGYIDLTCNKATIMHYTKEKVSKTPIVFISRQEQQQIADYLDKKCEEIDKVVETEKTVIEFLKEYKQSIITEAVMKGLDKSVPLKNSGIEWIGKIPQHWKTLRIKNVAWLKGRIGWQGLKSDEYRETGAYLITGTDFDNGKINWDTCVHITQERFAEAPEIHIKENDLLITKDGTVGKVALALNCPQDVSLNSGVLLIRNTKDIKYNSKYLYYVLLSNVFWNWFTSNLNGNSTIIHLYQEQFYNFSFAYPTIDEQKQIADYLDKKCSEIDKAITGKEQLIEKLAEYKKSLIYECVTGKRKVV